MPNEKNRTHLSRFLSLVLRHQPEIIALTLDGQGWASVEDLLQKLKTKGFLVDRQGLQQLVDTNNKQRFAFNADGTKIRASQGHSVPVDLGYSEMSPPAILYHGTAEENLALILRTGLCKQKRHHVHLSADRKSAIQVGSRHGKPVVIEVAAEKMHVDGYTFFLSANGVWLTETVPAAYLKLCSH